MKIKIMGIENQVIQGQDEMGQQDEIGFEVEYAEKLTDLLSQEPAIDFCWCALKRLSQRLYFSQVVEDIKKVQLDILILDLGWGGDDDKCLETFAYEESLRWINSMDTENPGDDNFQGGMHLLKLLQENEEWKNKLWRQGRGIVVVTQYAYSHLARVTKELGADFLFFKDTFGASPRSKGIEKLIALIVTLYNGGNLDELRTAFPIEDLSDEEFAEIIPPTIADILVIHAEEGMAIEPWIDLWAKPFNPQHIYPSYISDVQGWNLFSKRISHILEADKEQLLSPTAIIFHRINEFDSPEPSQFYKLFCDRMWDLLRHTSEMNLGSKYIKKCHLIFTITSEQRKDWAQLLPKKLADCIRTYRYRNDLRIEVLPIEPPIKWHEDRFQRYLRRNFKRLFMEIKETEPKSLIIESEAIEKLRNDHTYQNLLSLDGAIQKATENYPGDAVNVRITKDHIPETPPDRVMDQAAKQWPKSIEEGQAYVRRVVVKQLLTQALTGFNNYLLLAESGVTQSAIDEMKSRGCSLKEISFGGNQGVYFKALLRKRLEHEARKKLSEALTFNQLFRLEKMRRRMVGDSVFLVPTDYSSPNRFEDKINTAKKKVELLTKEFDEDAKIQEKFINNSSKTISLIQTNLTKKCNVTQKMKLISRDESKYVKFEADLEVLRNEYSLFVDLIFASTLLQKAHGEEQLDWKMTLFEAAYQMDPYNPIIIDEYLNFLTQLKRPASPLTLAQVNERWQRLIKDSAKDYNEFRIFITDEGVVSALFAHWEFGGFRNELITTLRLPILLPRIGDLDFTQLELSTEGLINE
ncbi:TPA: hypothetical protein EYP66_15775 [Candidatus Poribacteria bacterium]|nr:hypothetical protein [Candidatus Poribacteria bacterium]